MIHHASTQFNVRSATTIVPNHTLPNHILKRSCQLAMPALFLCLACGLSFAITRVQADATAGNSARYQRGLRNSTSKRQLSAKQIEKVLKSLREKTGFLEMSFGEAGFLTLGDRLKFVGGSATARELMIAVVDRAKAIDLECHDHSTEVAFARLAKPIIYLNHSNGAQVEVFPVEIDFSDFNHLRGDKVALAAFDVGFVVLHELAHAALGLRDAQSADAGPGECEEYINRIRQELGLPERQNYIAQTHTRTILPNSKPLQHAELFFAQTPEQPARSSGRGKSQPLNLIWEAERVGIVRPASFTAQSTTAKTLTSLSKGQALLAP